MSLKILFQGKVFTLSNFLSVLRILLIPVLGYYIAAGDVHSSANVTALVIAVIMVITDFLDGFLARAMNEQSPLGQYLDPFADKLSLVAGLFFLVLYRDFPDWLFYVVLVREILGSAGGLFLLFGHGTLGRPNYWGKTGVALLSLSGLAYLMDWSWKLWTVYPIVIVLFVGAFVYYLTYRHYLFIKK